MNKCMKKDIDNYIKEINANIICDFKTRKKYLADIKNSIYDYIDEANAENMDEIYNQFGTPQEISKSFFDGADIKKIKKRMNFTKVIIIGAVIALAMFAVALMASFVDVYKSNRGYGVEYIADSNTYYFDKDGRFVLKNAEEELK